MRPYTLAMFWSVCCIYLLEELGQVQPLDWPWSTGSCSHLHPTCVGSDQSTKPSGTIAPCTSWSSSSLFSSNFYWPSYFALALDPWVAGNVYFEITFIYHPFSFKVRLLWEGHKIWKKNLPLSNVKWKIFTNFVAFSEYPNFNRRWHISTPNTTTKHCSLFKLQGIS